MHLPLPARLDRHVTETVTARIAQAGDTTIVTVGTRSFRIQADAPAGGPARETADFALYGLAPLAMTHNLAIRLDAEVSRSALERLHAMGRIWEGWNGIDLFPLALSAASVVDDTGDPARTGGSLCLSGGLDSTYATLRAVEDGYSHAVLIDGFDHVNKKVKGFELVHERVARQAEIAGLGLVRFRTDYTGTRPDLGLFHTYFLAMALHYVGRLQAAGAFAADNPVHMDFERHPWGNNTVVAAHLGTESFPVEHRGADVTRTEKLVALAREAPEAIPLLTVCTTGNGTRPQLRRLRQVRAHPAQLRRGGHRRFDNLREPARPRRGLAETGAAADVDRGPARPPLPSGRDRAVPARGAGARGPGRSAGAAQAALQPACRRAHAPLPQALRPLHGVNGRASARRINPRRFPSPRSRCRNPQRRRSGARGWR